MTYITVQKIKICITINNKLPFRARAEFQRLDTRLIEVKTFDCGKVSVTTYLRRYAAKNAKLNLSHTFLLPYAPDTTAPKLSVAAYYTLAYQTLARESIPAHKGLPRYPVPVVLLAQLDIDSRFQ